MFKRSTYIRLIIMLVCIVLGLGFTGRDYIVYASGSTKVVKLNDGDTYTINVRSKGVKYSVSGNCVTVSRKGVVRAISPGTSKVYYTVGSKKCVIEFKVLESPSLSTLEETVEQGSAYQLELYNTVSGGSTRWSSSDPSVAKVSSTGRVTGVSPGVAVVTAIYKGRSFRCKITVTREVYLYTLSDVAQYVEPIVIRAFKQFGFSYKHSVGLHDSKLRAIPAAAYFSIDQREIRCLDATGTLVLHEFGHFVNHLKGYISSTSEFLSIYEKERNIGNLSSHVINSSSEYFAECYMMYKMEPEKLKQMYPLTYAFLVKTCNSLCQSDLDALYQKYKSVWGFR